MIQTHPSVMATPGPGPSRPKSCANVPNLRRNFQPNGASQNHNTGTRGVMFCCVASTSFAAKVRLVSFTPSTSSVPFRKKGRDPSRPRKKITVHGWEKEEEEEERAAPTTRRQLERLHLVFRNTLLMCLAAFPQFPQFNLTKEDLDSFYDWFYGPELGGRRPSLRNRHCLWQRF